MLVVNRRVALLIVKLLKKIGATLRYFNGNIFTVEIFNRVVAIPTATEKNVINFGSAVWSANYIKNNQTREWVDIPTI